MAYSIMEKKETEEVLTSPATPRITVTEIEIALRDMKCELEQAKQDKTERERYLKLKEIQIQELQRKLEEKEKQEKMPILLTKETEDNPLLIVECDKPSVIENDIEVENIHKIIKEKDRENAALRAQLKKSLLELFDACDRIKFKQSTINQQKQMIEEQKDTIEMMGKRIVELTNRLYDAITEVETLKEEAKRNITFSSRFLRRHNSTSSEPLFFSPSPLPLSASPLSFSLIEGERDPADNTLNDWEEEKLVLTRQVNAYSDQCDSLKRRLQEIHDNHATEVEKLNTELQSISHDSGHLNAVNAQLETERERNRKLTEQLATERKNNEALNIKIDDFRERMYEANKVLKEKVDYLESESARLRKEKLQIQHNPVSSSDPYGYHTPHYDESAVHVHQPNGQEEEKGEFLLSQSSCVFYSMIQTPSFLSSHRHSDSEINDPPALTEEQMKSLFRKNNNSTQLITDTHNIDKTIKTDARKKRSETMHLSNPSQDCKLSQSIEYSLEMCKYKMPEQCSLNNDKVMWWLSKEDREEPVQIDPYEAQIDREIQENAQWVREQSKRPTTEEVVEDDDDSSLPYDPNLVCPKCGKRYHIGGIQKFKRHVKELCPLLERR